MKLHTVNQAREGEQKASLPVSEWAPSRAEYLQYLVDSRLVFGCFEDIVDQHDELATLRNSGCPPPGPAPADPAGATWHPRVFRLAQPRASRGARSRHRLVQIGARRG